MMKLPNLKRGLVAFSSAVFLGGGSLFLEGKPALAADELVLTYGVLQTSIPIADLEALASTGTVSNQLSFYLNLANLAPNLLRTVLTSELPIHHNLLDDLLNSEGGEYLLSEITQIVHTPSQQANLQALRSEVVLAADDRQITLLEVLQNYPTQQVFINGANLLQLARELKTPVEAEE
jgi:hypothetical protein